MRTMRRWWLTVGVSVCLSAVGFLLAQEKGGGEETGPYELVTNWPENPCGPGYQVGSTAGIFAERPDRVFIFMRGCLPALADGTWGRPQSLVPSRNASGYDLSQEDPARHPRWDHILWIVNREGKLVESWEQHNARFVRPHRVLMDPYDPERHVWLVDDGAHMIYKFTNDGKRLVMTLGEFKVPGQDDRHFARPTDIAWLPDGTFFISDGYGGTRVAKFDRNGRFLMDWGGPPKDPSNPGPNEFNTVHSIAISKDRRVFVVDRGHRRFQVFDEHGKFLDMFSTGVYSSPYAHLISTDQYLWVADGGTHRILKYDLKGNFLYGWGVRGGLPGQFNGPHSLTVDQEGNLYIAEVFNGRVQKFRPKPGADRSKLVGQELRWGATNE